MKKKSFSNFCREVRVSYRAPKEIRKIGSPADVAPIMREIAPDNRREHFIAIYLDGAHNVMGYQLVTTGLANRTQIHPREVFQPAIAVGAVACVVAHNHPSGDTRFSEEDKAVTSRLTEAGKILGISLLDHLVITDTSFNSGAEEGLI